MAFKTTKLVAKYIALIIGEASSILVFLIWLGFIPETLNGVKFVTDYLAFFGLLAVAIFFVCTLWLGSQIYAWRTRKTVSATRTQGKNINVLEKDERNLLWTATIIMEIFGFVGLYVLLGNLFSISLSSPFATNLVIVMTMGVIGIILAMAIFAWFSISQFLEAREFRKRAAMEEEATYQVLIKKFRRSFKDVQETSDPDIQVTMLENFQDDLLALCNSYEWTRVKKEVEDVLNTLIPEKLFHEPNSNRYMQFLVIIINRFGEYVKDDVNKRWSKEIEKLYKDPEFSTTSISNVLYLLLQLHGYSKDCVMGLVDDATRWSDLKYRILKEDLRVAFGEMKKRDESGYEDVVSYLRRKMIDAKQNKEASYARLLELFEMANKQ